MRCERERLGAPGRQAKQRTNTDSPKTSGVGSLGTIEAPVEIPLRSRSVHLCIDAAIVALLINHQPFRAGFDQRFIFRRLHRPELE